VSVVAADAVVEGWDGEGTEGTGNQGGDVSGNVPLPLAMAETKEDSLAAPYRSRISSGRCQSMIQLVENFGWIAEHKSRIGCSCPAPCNSHRTALGALLSMWVLSCWETKRERKLSDGSSSLAMSGV
jgi:hypothetical protein